MAGSVQEIKEELSSCSVENAHEIIGHYVDDPRKGVQAALETCRRRIRKHNAELERCQSLWQYEKQCVQRGYSLIAGIDEVGRGPLAGPVMTAAVILGDDFHVQGINDSKKLTPKKRELLYNEIIKHAKAYAFGMISPAEIDEINILQATLAAMRQAVTGLTIAPDFVLVDALTIPNIKAPQKSIIKGDAKSMSIAAASILAKVERDRLMVAMDGLYPGYGFAANKGYGSQEHIDAIRAKGLCPIHRRSFVKNIIGGRDYATDNGKHKGNAAEAAAAMQMIKLGYEILETNFYGMHSEIDIIAKKDGIIVFTEVKFRTQVQAGHPAEAVDKRKQSKIKRAALHYIAQKELQDTSFRFDVAELMTRNGTLYFHYIEDAFA